MGVQMRHKVMKHEREGRGPPVGAGNWIILRILRSKLREDNAFIEVRRS